MGSHGNPFITFGIPTDWFDTTFKRRVKITINMSQVPTTQTDFPFLFNSVLKDLEFAKSNGDDIRFALTDTTELDVEVQEIETGMGDGNFLIAWTKIPSISDGLEFFMYYNKPSASSAGTSQAVWSDYIAVYHMDTTTSTLPDSTGNFDGVITGTTDVAGKIGRARNFPGAVLNYIQLPVTLEIPVTGTGKNYTVQAWLRDDNGNPADEHVVIVRQTANTHAPPFFNWGLFDKTTFRPSSTLSAAGVLIEAISPNNTIVMGVFAKIDGTYDGNVSESPNNLKIIVDGVVAATTSVVTDIENSGANTMGPRMGSRIDDTAERLLGIIDEVRVMSITRSVDFLATEFNNQDTPGAFYTIGSVEIIP